jgi:hypothetical protein
MTSCPLCQVSVPGWPNRAGGDDYLAGAADSVSSTLRQRKAFSLEIDVLICSFFSFVLAIGTKDNHASFADAQGTRQRIIVRQMSGTTHMLLFDIQDPRYVRCAPARIRQG